MRAHPILPALVPLLFSLASAACSGAIEPIPPASTTPTSPTPSSPSPMNPTTPTPPTSVAAVPCQATVTTELPGITATVKTARCDFTVAQAAAGIKIDYALVVAADLPPLYIDGYVTGTPVTGFTLSARLAGNGEEYCLCDTGPRPTQVSEVHVKAGSEPGSFEWDGKNWTGPSDTGDPEGAAFPPGSYVLTLRNVGARAQPTADRPYSPDYSIDVTIPITLVP